MNFAYFKKIWQCCIAKKMGAGRVCDLTENGPLRLNRLNSVNSPGGRPRRRFLLPGASNRPRVKDGLAGRLGRRYQVAAEFDISVIYRVNGADGLQHHRVG